ncbi:MAG: hypothetical protein IKB97_05350 [Bacteroidaceae bacterium]|nr:hypothetical protein [Bacteroidaceae bacterium]
MFTPTTLNGEGYGIDLPIFFLLDVKHLINDIDRIEAICYNDYDETKEETRMDLHHYGIIFILVGFLISLVWIVLDNKKFYEELDKQRYGWYNKEEEKPRRTKQ